jgi:hypothetical protein
MTLDDLYGLSTAFTTVHFLRVQVVVRREWREAESCT